MLTRWLTKSLTAKPLYRLCAWVIQCFWKIPVICTHTHTHKSNPIIRIFRHTLFRDTHVASRSTLFGVGELALDIKGRCSILLLSLPLPLPISSGLGFFIFYLLPFLKLDRKFLLFHQILSLSVWQMLILPHPPTRLTWHCYSLFCATTKIVYFYLTTKSVLFQQHQRCLDIRVQRQEHGRALVLQAGSDAAASPSSPAKHRCSCTAHRTCSWCPCQILADAAHVDITWAYKNVGLKHLSVFPCISQIGKPMIILLMVCKYYSWTTFAGDGAIVWRR